MKKQVIVGFLLALFGAGGQAWGAASAGLSQIDAFKQALKEYALFDADTVDRVKYINPRMQELMNGAAAATTQTEALATAAATAAKNTNPLTEAEQAQFLQTLIDTLIKIDYKTQLDTQDPDLYNNFKTCIETPGLDLTKKPTKGAETILTIAATRNQLKLVKDIVKQVPKAQRKAFIDQQNNGGRTALHIAASNKKLDIVNYLLEQGADPNIGDKQEKTLLHMLLHNPTPEVLPIIDSILTKNPDVNKQTAENQTPLMMLARSSASTTSPEIVKQCFEKLWNHAQAQHTPLNLNTQDNDGNTALHEFITLYEGFLDSNPNADLSFFKELLEKGANPLIPNNDMTFGQTPLLSTLFYSQQLADIIVKHTLTKAPESLGKEILRLLQGNEFMKPAQDPTRKVLLMTALQKVADVYHDFQAPYLLFLLTDSLEALKAKLVTLAQELAKLPTH
ncbi:ankyrin repeat domain-containing protein [Candidatus Babeliales bacterium]|nr:ankyrin repeat domain-containing protein [Candidatus Babeliales bacterium]